eukprot:COSAG01_NODE_4_length_55812_cov_1344.168109_43_plen_294_part_00
MNINKNKFNGLVLFPLLLSVLLFQGCLQTKSQPENWLAKVGKNFITSDVFNARLQQMPEQVRKQFEAPERKQGMLDQLINEELLYLEAKSNKIDKTEAYKSALNKAQTQMDLLKRQTLITELVSQKVANAVEVKPEEVQQYYKQNTKQFASFEKRRASHILVKTRKEALSLKSKLRRGASFEKLAMANSLDPTGKQGGDLGWFTRGQLEKSFETAVFGMKSEGQISSVVKTQFGYHVIKLDGMEVVPTRTFEQVKSQIQQALFSNKQRAQLDTYITSLKEKYKVQMKEEAAKS